MARLNKSPKDKDFNDIFRNISDISNALYFLLDHILLLNRMNFHKFDPKFINKVDFWSNFAWCIECITNLIYDLVDYYRNSLTINKYVEDIKKLDNADSKGKNFLTKRIQRISRKS